MLINTSARHIQRKAADPWLRLLQCQRLSSNLSLKEAIAKKIPEKLELVKELKSKYGQKTVGDIKVDNILGGMRGLTSLVWESSLLDAEEGIRFHHKSIQDCQKLLPTAPDGNEMLPESMLWLLLTGENPSKSQIKQLCHELASNGSLPTFLTRIIDSFPKTLHPMVQLSMAVGALSHSSSFAKGYEMGSLKKSEYWSSTFDDSMNLIAKLPAMTARIYLNVHGNQGAAQKMPEPDKNGDLASNYARFIGYDKNKGFIEVLRLYLALHGDHEGGNVSAHTTHLVGSALADPYLSYSAALCGLAGPLHGLANQEVLSFVLKMKETLGSNTSHEDIKNYLWSILKSNRVIPGYGHAVLRKPDPRFEALENYAKKNPKIAADPIVSLVLKIKEVATDVLLEHGKTKNPYPNVDAISGSLLWYYGYTHFNTYTTIFGISRALGAVSQLVWDRALGFPIERPKSITLSALKQKVLKN